MKPILIVTEPFDGYANGWIIDDPKEIKNILSSKNASKVKKSELKSPEEAEKWYRQKTIDDALALNLPDGVFRIVFYNSQYSHCAPDKQIDPYEVFSPSPRDEVENWIMRSKTLMSSNYEVGDALVGKSANYEVIREHYISSNPGFSGDTYAHAIHLGASKAVH
ncbi:MAG: hypothetical protein H6R05_596 [Burkholderiaceae bacterium]|nr:hypothetical protein [Burkholderiaceae bacterium]